MSTRDTIRLATRSSDLALRQAATVKEALEDRRQDVELVEVETKGDRIRDELIHRLGKTGAFVRSLDEKVLDGDVDAAVHSMKDMPTDQPDELIVSGIPDRGSPGDVLVTPDGTSLEDLPDDATVGTSSLRRQAQLLDARPELTVEPLRGNVDTRIEKLLAPGMQAEHEARTDAEKEKKGETENDEYEHPYDRDVEEWFSDLAEIERRAMEREIETEYDAIVLAEAGLDRSGLLHHIEYERLPMTEFVPSPGQGAIAVTSLDNEVGETLHTVLDSPRTRVETSVERTILAELGGGCVAPIGIYAVVQGEYVNATVQVYSRDGGETVATSRDLAVERYARDARAFAEDLADQGAAELIEEARREEGEGEAKRGEEE
ncbi:hydroxymethylbilane synthase [Natronoarchaeum sp. GCM10025321]|uniref:hydroxymethylbilane synthase n=1 Tax=Natronoarchaeum sp. GCM10025321 TaxID=3252684 RepID=UPI00361E6FE5